MQKKTYRFSGGAVDIYTGGGMNSLRAVTDPRSTVLITDEHVYKNHRHRFKNWNTIVLKAGEQYKVQSTADALIEQLIEMEADRKTTLVGVGGGVITDITGYVASLYMRGLRFGFVPTTVLGMVDASIGGKNGVDVGVYKNMSGLVRHPAFILYDMAFLQTLPEAEWRSGFAEIIKHAAIKDAKMFAELEKNQLGFYRSNKKSIAELVKRNVGIKIKVVQQDEFEKGDRSLLNFGHTLGHALENQYELTHGEAISIGMVFAAGLSGELNGFKQAERVENLLLRYGLPAHAVFNKKKVFRVLKMDKKRERDEMHFVMLDAVGRGMVKNIALKKIESFINQI